MRRELLFCSVIPIIAAQQTVYGQCGGTGWKGPTTCTSGSTCVKSNDYYSQCLPGGSPSTSSVNPTTTPTLSTSSSSQSTTGTQTSTSQPSYTDLNGCFSASGVPFDKPGSSDWNTDALPFNQRLAYTPAAIAVPTNAAQVQGAVACAVQLGFKVNAKGGGHSYASHGLGGENGHLVIELDRMNSVTVNSTSGVAVVQAGARLGHVLTQLDSQGKRAISHGTCPGVGVSGHALHGGYGMSSRKHGLAVDAIVGAYVVLANSSLVHASATENPDIFWAIRGAGSNFGVVTSFEFQTFAQPSQVTYFQINTNWNSGNMAANLYQLENYSRTAIPAELTMRFSMSSGGGNFFEGMYWGSQSDFTNAISPLLNSLNPKQSISSATQTDFKSAFQHYAGPNDNDPSYPYSYQENFYSKSLTLNHINGSAANAWVNYLFQTGPTNNRYWWLQMDIHGGANSAVTNGDFSTSAYAHRDKIFLIQFYDRVFSGSYPSDGFSFLDGMVSSITSNMQATDWGMYINYADSRLDRTTAQNAYYGKSLKRLQSIKAAVDPKEVFYNPESIQAIAS